MVFLRVHGGLFAGARWSFCGCIMVFLWMHGGEVCNINYVCYHVL